MTDDDASLARRARPYRASLSRWQQLVAVATIVSLCGCGAAPRTWVAYYGRDAPPEVLQNYDVIVVDDIYESSPALLKTKGGLVFAYLSIGEVASHRQHFATARDQALTIEENANWKGAWLVDVRDKRWQKLVVERLVPAFVKRGFDGLFLDTIDSALHLERVHPKRFKGMDKAVMQLLKTIHTRYPHLKLLLNGALPLLGQLQDEVSMVAIESTLTTWNFKTKRSRWLTVKERSTALRALRQARKAQPNLTICTLDYWDPDARGDVRTIYRKQRKQGFVPYVATIALDRVVSEPSAATPTQAPASSSPLKAIRYKSSMGPR